MGDIRAEEAVCAEALEGGSRAPAGLVRATILSTGSHWGVQQEAGLIPSSLCKDGFGEGGKLLWSESGKQRKAWGGGGRESRSEDAPGDRDGEKWAELRTIRRENQQALVPT